MKVPSSAIVLSQVLPYILIACIFSYVITLHLTLDEHLRNDHVDILKIDVEGSEYQMLEGMITSGTCQNVNQLTIEWHHYDYDIRYGASSIPILNMFQKLLQDQCGLSQFWLKDLTGWPSNSEMYLDMKLTLLYNLASFRRIDPK